MFTRRGCDRIMRYAFELAKTRKRHVTSATKSNGIIYTMPFWDERFAAMAKEYPDVRTDQFHIDILTRAFRAASRLVRRGGRLESFRRYSFGPGSRGRGFDRHRPFGKSQSRARIPFHVRAGARLGAGHRRKGHRQSDRPNLVRRDDAAPFGRERTPPTPSSAPSKWCWRAAARARRILAERQIRRNWAKQSLPPFRASCFEFVWRISMNSSDEFLPGGASDCLAVLRGQPFRPESAAHRRSAAGRRLRRQRISNSAAANPFRRSICITPLSERRQRDASGKVDQRGGGSARNQSRRQSVSDSLLRRRAVRARPACSIRRNTT